MRRILFVQPIFESDFVLARGKLASRRMAPSMPMTPLQFATLAALTPPDRFEADIWDESWRGEIDDRTDLGKTYDLAGVTGYQAHLPRALELAAIFRRRGILTVVGGPGVTGTPEVCRGAFDVLFLGEGELTWPRFLDDWEKGQHRQEYRQVERIDLSLSPAPRWDSIARDIARYRFAGVQTTRGCPFDCDFCDVIHLFGRKPRHKPVDQVIKEIAALERLGVSHVFLCDDDFVGDPKYAKQLLKALLPVNNSFTAPLAFSTQATIHNSSNDDELLDLMADCNLTTLHIGIETPRAASLKETNKLQNLRTDLVEACRKIQAHGITVRALLIVGFDSDDADIFEEQRKFIEDAGIICARINTLKAYPGTPLWIRMQREHRVIEMTRTYAKSVSVSTNLIPKQMTRVELLEGYRELLRKVRSPESIERRAVTFLSGVTRRPRVKRAPILHSLRRALRARQGAGQVTPELRSLFRRVAFRTLRTAPHMLSRVLTALGTQIGEALVHPYHHAVIQEEIDEAVKGNIKIDHDPSVGTVPANFRLRVREVLPSVYEQLEAEIPDRGAIPTAMLGVVRDFLTRWGATFSEFEPHHHTYLTELCARYTDRYREEHGAQSAEPSGRALTRDELRNPQFVQALMAGVEQELRSGTKAGPFPILGASA